MTPSRAAVSEHAVVAPTTPGGHPYLHAADVALAAILLPLAVPVLLVTGVTIALLSKRSPFVAHLRIGRSGLPFWMLKFRSMWSPGTPDPQPWQWIDHVSGGEVQEVKPRRDPRVTSPFAMFCRTYSLDELPQLVHVLTGRMSLVGPRPLTEWELRKYYGRSQAEVLTVRPGITGLWQVKGRNNLSYSRRIRYDLFLVRNYSWRLYVYVLLRTLPRVLSGTGAW